MINGNPNEFVDTIYTCQDIVFVYAKIKYWFQGYVVEGKVLALTESALEKISQMSNEEFDTLELYPDFDA